MRAHFIKGRFPRKCAVGAGYAPPATLYYTEYDGLVCRGGIYAARQFCSSRPIPRRGGVTPPYRAIKMCPRMRVHLISYLLLKKSALLRGRFRLSKNANFPTIFIGGYVPTMKIPLEQKIAFESPLGMRT